MGEILVIAALVLIVVGPERLPEMMRMAGKGYAQLRRAADDLRKSFIMEADRMEAEQRLKDLQRRREEAAEARKQALDSAGPGAVAQEERIVPPAPASDAPPADAPPADKPVNADGVAPGSGSASSEPPDPLPRVSLMPPPPPQPPVEDGGADP